MKVFVVVIEHKHDTDILVFDVYEKARAHVAAYAREWWDDRADLSARADHREFSNEEVIDSYFDENEQEFYQIRECEIG